MTDAPLSPEDWTYVDDRFVVDVMPGSTIDPTHTTRDNLPMEVRYLPGPGYAVWIQS